jgi:predicted RNA-binding protein YlxR (DUF448 family)
LNAESRKERQASERRCIATGDVRHKADLIRFIVGPDGDIGPDLAEKLPGRGIWVTCTRAAVEQAIAKKAFARAAKAKVQVADDLADRVEALLTARAAETLGLARRSGTLTMGLERVLEALDRGDVGAVIEAKDAGRDGARRLRAKLKAAGLTDLPVAEGLGAEQMGLALGRLNVVHAGLKDGRMKDKVLADLARVKAWGGYAASGSEGKE